MTETRLDKDRIAIILVEAIFYGDKTTARKHSITQRTIQRYRANAKEDSQLSELVASKKQLYAAQWFDDIPVAVRGALNYIHRATQQENYSPEVIHAVAGALKIVAEIGLTKEYLDARFGLSYREESTTQPARLGSRA